MFRIPAWVYLSGALIFVVLALLCFWQVGKNWSKRWPW